MEALEKAKDFWNAFSGDDIDNLDIPTLNAGDYIEIYWKDVNYKYELSDKGYVFTIPGIQGSDDCGNFIIHIPKPNGGDKEDCPEVHIHLIDLLMLPELKEIKRIKEF